MNFQDIGSAYAIYNSLDRASQGTISKFLKDCKDHDLEPKIVAVTPKDGFPTPVVMLHGATKKGETAIFGILFVQDSTHVWKLRAAERLKMPTIADILNLPEPVSRDN